MIYIFMDFDKYIKLCIYHHNIIQDVSMTAKSPYAAPLKSTLPSFSSLDHHRSYFYPFRLPFQ